MKSEKTGGGKIEEVLMNVQVGKKPERGVC